MFPLVQFKDSLPMRDGMIGNLLESALSHILKSHIFAFAVAVFVEINSPVNQVLDLPCLFLLRNRMLI